MSFPASPPSKLGLALPHAPDFVEDADAEGPRRGSGRPPRSNSRPRHRCSRALSAALGTEFRVILSPDFGPPRNDLQKQWPGADPPLKLPTPRTSNCRQGCCSRRSLWRRCPTPCDKPTGGLRPCWREVWRPASRARGAPAHAGRARMPPASRDAVKLTPP